MLRAVNYAAGTKRGKICPFYAGKKCIRCNCTNHTTHDKRWKSRIRRQARVNMSLVPCAGKIATALDENVYLNTLFGP